MTDDELKALVQDMKRHMDVVAEGLRSDVRQVAEGLLGFKGEQRESFGRVWQEFDETRAMIKFSHAELDRRMRTLEQGLADLQARVERLESGTQ